MYSGRLISSLAITMQIDIRYVFLIEIAKLYDHRMHISVIRKGMNLENGVLKKSVEALKSESHKEAREGPIFSSLKKQLDDDCTSEDERIDNATGYHFNLPSQDVKSSDQISSCPYPSKFEEMCGEMCGYTPPSGSPSNCTSKSYKKKGKSKNLGNSNKTFFLISNVLYIKKPIMGHKQLHKRAHPKKGVKRRITACDKNPQNTKSPKLTRSTQKKLPHNPNRSLLHKNHAPLCPGRPMCALSLFSPKNSSITLT
jgi:hypothetical protein